MTNLQPDTRATKKDIRIGNLKYGVYLVTEPVNHFFNYAGSENQLYELDKNYFINEAVKKRLKNEQGGLEKVA